MENSKLVNRQLSKNFNLDEFVVSQTAERFGYNNTPDNHAISNLKELCVNVLQPLREIIRVPVFISSGFRCPSANAVIGGLYNSQHLEGKAADSLTPTCCLSDSYIMLLKNLPVDQLIFEFGRWIHVSYNGNANRRQAMVSKRISGEVVYEAVEKKL